MKKEELFYHIPEIQFPCDELHAWAARNEKHFHKNRGYKYALNGVMIPASFAKILNDQIKLDLAIYNKGMPLFDGGQLFILTEEYPMHDDKFRDTALNYVLAGDGVTMWDEGTVCEYKTGVATLFNPQVPHVIFPKGDVPRMAVSFSVSMSYQRVVTLYKAGMLFETRDRIWKWTEIVPE